MITLHTQVRCIEEELARRKRTYPKQVEAGNMSQERADREIINMEAALQTMRNVEATPGINWRPV